MNSIAGKQSFINSSAYNASKYGLRGFANGLREELRDDNIKVVSVYPGAVNTPFWDSIDGKYPRSEMLDVEVLSNTIINSITCPGNLTIEEIVARRVAGDF